MSDVRLYLNEIEYNQVLDYFCDPDHWEPENILLELLLRTGMRQGELVRLTPESFYFHPDYVEVKIKAIKGSRDRRARLDKDYMARLKPVVRAMEAARCPTVGLFLSSSHCVTSQTKRVRRAAVRILNRALGKGHGFTAHAFRHTYSRLAFETLNQDIYLVMRAMGHAQVGSTQRYATHKDGEEIADRMMGAIIRARGKESF